MYDIMKNTEKMEGGELTMFGLDRKLLQKNNAADKIRGSLIGGACGDALGYAIEFSPEREIFARYGAEGIVSYELDPRRGEALISDDTQMTMFTANGLVASVRDQSPDEPRAYVAKAYQDWLLTQRKSYRQVMWMEPADLYGNVTWLLRNPKMYHLRAPGNTCLSALIGNEDTVVPDYIASPRNGSKGCGGVMRVAPVALMPYNEPIEKIDMEAAQVAAITHGNSLGYMPAALLVHIIRRIVYPEQTMTLKEIVLEGCDTIYRLFRADANVDRMVSIIQDAVRLSHSSVVTDLEAIHKLGEGWVGEEALAIAVFCALKYENDFGQALIAAVNHGGDSDSTGAICGNILGAIVGLSGIGEEWKEHLELSDEIMELADEIISI